MLCGMGTDLPLSLWTSRPPLVLPPPPNILKGEVLGRGHLTVTSNPVSVSQMVNMHMEKVARREIGTLATVQRLPPSQKIIAPESLPPLTPYYRKPLNFGCLDDIGHGIKVKRGAPPLSLQPTLFCLTGIFSLEPQLSSTAMFLSPPAASFLPQSLKPSS